MTTKTARFELINPYQKYGLKRKPTFNEILGLISEDQQLLRPFPDRTATQFRNSPQGSFFDGADHVELLKEQQNRIMDRQMRQMMLQRQSQQNGQTFHVEQHRDASGSATPIETVQGDSGMVTPQSIGSDVDVRTYLAREPEQRRRQTEQRQQEVGQRHSQAVNRLNDTLTHNMLNRGFTGLLDMPRLETPPEEEDVSTEELIPDDEYEELTMYEKGVFNFSNDWKSVLINKSITIDGIMFQLFYRDLLTDEITRQVENEPNDMSKKLYLLTLIDDLIKDGNWNTLADANKLKTKKNEWKNIKRNRSSSSGGVVRQFLSSAGSAASSALSVGLQEVGKGAVKGAIGAMTGT